MAIQLGDKVRIAQSRLALTVSPYYHLYQELWQKYGKREGKVIGFFTSSVHKIDNTHAAIIQFDDGDITVWELHLLDKV